VPVNPLKQFWELKGTSKDAQPEKTKNV